VIWLNLLSLIRKMPFFGIYVVMFTDVFKTFLKVSGVVLLFVISFSFGFYALLANQPYFPTWSLALIKTFVMTTGELEYDNLFFDNKFNDPKYIVHYEWTTRIFFIVFAVIMPIIIMNLLVGLAVDDIKVVQENAILKRLAMQVCLTGRCDN
jgi:transient receptor potential cation channel subfamily A protein 1